MYIYDIVSLDVSEKREGLSLKEDYSHIIQQKAQKGWRFVQVVNLTNLARGQRRIDLIFEKKES
ncbi:hypothetical protein HMPREF2767_00320 [Nosocomiicoccus sp. HMSC067E10]|uniref:DUF4177 domain-containing protein n=1 Tax=Nosocomiicoccus sp. HMSC067E10 TaxID=1739271 RepID=UPI0008A57F1A|nr:DUF4177 domain-containing protein [Nosocomiicoccus sp. HMSC067E10]OFL49830.1 hypothetical protein HMPREF2767_00320 [Nosocomiicoccus sp. HMSC067E10]